MNDIERPRMGGARGRGGAAESGICSDNAGSGKKSSGVVEKRRFVVHPRVSKRFVIEARLPSEVIGREDDGERGDDGEMRPEKELYRFGFRV